MAGGDRGKDFERMMANLLREVCSDVRRVFDARSFREVAKYAPAVHCDYEAVVTYKVSPSVEVMIVANRVIKDREPKPDLHLYFEMKASKERNSYPFRSLIKGTIRKGKTGDSDSDWSKYGQFGFCRKVALNAASEQYWYIVGCRYTPGAYYALLLDWEDVAFWLSWLESERKASVPWEMLKRRAMECGGLDRILYQVVGDTSDMRFAGAENVEKLRRVLGIEDWVVVEWQ